MFRNQYKTTKPAASFIGKILMILAHLCNSCFFVYVHVYKCI